MESPSLFTHSPPLAASSINSHTQITEIDDHSPSDSKQDIHTFSPIILCKYMQCNFSKYRENGKADLLKQPLKHSLKKRSLAETSTSPPIAETAVASNPHKPQSMLQSLGVVLREVVLAPFMELRFLAKMFVSTISRLINSEVKQDENLFQKLHSIANVSRSTCTLNSPSDLVPRQDPITQVVLSYDVEVDLNGIIRNNADSKKQQQQICSTMKEQQKNNINKGYRDLLSHFVILPNGDVLAGRHPRYEDETMGGTLRISMFGNFSTQKQPYKYYYYGPTDKQIKATIYLIVKLLHLLNLPLSAFKFYNETRSIPSDNNERNVSQQTFRKLLDIEYYQDMHDPI